MRWSTQSGTATTANALVGLEHERDVVATVTSPEFAGVTFHEVLAKSALNRVPGGEHLPFAWTVNPYRGCTHACAYCFARPTHHYLELNAGAGFDSEIVVKINVADVLRRELLKPTWGRHHVALGTNTDPYQRAEGKYRLMPEIISAFVDSGTPFSILTKGPLIRRDLPLFQRAAGSVRVDLGLSIAVFDEALQKSVEPGTPTTAARLATVAAIRDAGLECTVFMMPILPFLTDSDEHIEHAVSRLAEAGASSVQFGPLHLKPGVKPWYFHWVERHHPHLSAAYRELYQAGAHPPREYSADLTDRVRAALHRYGIQNGGLLGSVTQDARRSRTAAQFAGFEDSSVPRNIGNTRGNRDASTRVTSTVDSDAANALSLFDL